jgi:hypothetical protein
MSQQGVSYSVDIVFCVDSTGSMSGLIDTVKNNAVRFDEDLARTMDEKSKMIDSLRIRVISFRDLYVDETDAFKTSPFYDLPAQKDEFSTFVNGIHADGGGDEPETGLEALAEAINSDWASGGDKRRQLIVLWTDASAHPLEMGAEKRGSQYPGGMPKNLDELTDMWEGQGHMSATAKRLILYAPDAYPWTDIETHWSNTIQYASKAGSGLSEVDYGTILDTIAQSI